MHVTHDRLPKAESKKYYQNLFLNVANKIKEVENLPEDVYFHFGKTDTRGNCKITYSVNDTNPISKFVYVNGWSGFNNMRELIAYCQGIIALKD